MLQDHYLLQANRMSFDPSTLLVPRATLFSLQRMSGAPDFVVLPENDEEETEDVGAGLDTTEAVEGADG